MARGRSPLVIIFITVFIDLVGFGLVIPVLPLYAETFNHPRPAVIGLLIASYSLMQFIFAPMLGKLSDRVGRRPVLLISLIGTSIGFLITALAGSLWVLFIGRIVDGITGGNIATAQAYIADVTPPEKRSHGMGLIGAAFGLGFIFGPAIGGILSPISIQAPFYFAAALAAVNALALFFLLPESLASEHRTTVRRRASLIQFFKEPGSRTLKTVLITNFFATVSFAMLTTLYALFTQKRFGYDVKHNGYILAYLGVIGALIQGGLLRRLVKVFGDKSLAVAGTLILGVGMFALPFSDSVLALFLASTSIAIGNSLMIPTLNALASKSVGPRAQGRALGVLQSSSSLGRIIGPSVGGWLLGLDIVPPVSHYGRAPFWTAGAIMMIAFVLALAVHEGAPSQEEPVAARVPTQAG